MKYFNQVKSEVLVSAILEDLMNGRKKGDLVKPSRWITSISDLKILKVLHLLR